MTAAAPPPVPSRDIDAEVRDVLRDVLALDAETAEGMTADTPLFGALPELDSMAVAGLLTELEDRLDILIDDDEVDGELFETFGSLTDFIRAKVAA
ncbi:acyl carrier protein [Pacificimonas sp. WHA3]|uniref:Acyl carrier protein n=1 Tax=Pacificimonas pallii TaxID=2827236 RepID=A0ABS6SGY6_9SPHN|nr:phosphopantetheine-binding protein [Pacificimonas pallii]MBV7257117.1 acyl carrier protein [Pacificimonas pallii]